MAAFRDVSPGEAWQPEPAERYNAVNRLLNDMGGGIYGGDLTAVADGRGAVIVHGSAGESIPAKMAVQLGSGAVVNAADPAGTIYPVDTTGSGGGVWGITLNACSSGGMVDIQIAGVAAVVLDGENYSPGAFIQPAGDGNTTFTSGGSVARLLAVAGSSGVVLLNPPTPSTGGGKIYAVVTPPANGMYGVGTVQEVEFTSGGANYTPVGEPVEKIFCALPGGLL